MFRQPDSDVFENIGAQSNRTTQSNVLGVTALLGGVFFFTGANALLTTLVVLKASENGFSSAIIGLLTSSYFAGFILGCQFGGNIVARVGHIRTFAGLAGLATICATLYPLAPYAAIWLVLRCIGGFAHAILQMTIESWLTTSTTHERRASMISFYRITDLSSVTLIQFAIVFKDISASFLFSVIAILVCLSLLPVVFSKTTGPAPISRAKPAVLTLARIAPMSVASAFSIGLVSSGFWGLSPIYLSAKGFGPDVVALFISAVITGGAIFQWPVGKFSDHVDRRLVIMGAALVGAVSCLFLPIVSGSLYGTLTLGLIYGGAALPIYALAVSHASDANESDEFVSLAGAVLMCFGVGAVSGPLIFSIVMQAAGENALFFSISSVLVLLFAFGMWRRREKAAQTADMKEDFIIVTRSTPEVFEMDPRSIVAEKQHQPSSEAAEQSVEKFPQ